MTYADWVAGIAARDLGDELVRADADLTYRLDEVSDWLWRDLLAKYRAAILLEWPTDDLSATVGPDDAEAAEVRALKRCRVDLADELLAALDVWS